MALLHLLRDQGRLVCAAHLDHGLRPESAGEALQLAEWCQQWGVELLTRRAPTQRFAQQWGCGLEAAGRRLRYAWLRRLARQRGALVVTAHTREDRAETLLMRLLRGTSLSGLAGPRRRRGSWLWRPLLEHSREELRQFLRERNLPWLEDPSNQELRFERNWVRERLIPLLQERNPRVQEALVRLADSAEGWRAWMEGGPQPPDRHYYQLQKSWRQARPDEGARLGRKHLELCSHWLRRPRGAALQVPGGLWLVGEEPSWRFVRLPSAPAPTPVALQEGEYVWEEWGLALRLERIASAQAPTLWQADLKLPEGATLLLRVRQPGDRWGRKKLKDLLNTWKVERWQRATWPLLCLNERVVWARGKPFSQEFLAAPGESAWRFCFRFQGDPPA